MIASMLNLLVLSAMVLLMLGAWILRVRFRQGDEKWLPRELQNAELVYAEKLFRSEGDVPIVAKCDRAYRLRSGRIVLLELKTRRMDKAYFSDTIELSAQRVAIQMQTGESVSEYGYVLVLQSGRRKKRWHRVQLLSHDEVFALVRRRESILLGKAVALHTCAPGLCARCAFAQECQSQYKPFV